MAIRSLARSSIRQTGRVNSALAGYESNYFHHLETVRLGGNAASVTFSNLSRYNDYQHLQLRMVSLSTTAYWFSLMFNGDTTSGNYRSHFLRGNTAGVVDSQAWAGTSKGAQLIGMTGSSSVPVPTIVDILDPFDTTKNTTVRGFTGFSSEVALTSGLWINTSAITSITINQESTFLYVAGSRFSLYGLKARA